MGDIRQIFSGMDTSISALQAQRQRMDVIASNLANAESTRTSKGGPYLRQQVVFETMLGEAQDNILQSQQPVVPSGSVHVAAVVADTRPPLVVHMPGHPDADSQGNVMMPDIKPNEELADMINAARSYEANAAAFKISRGFMQKALELGRT